METFSTLLAICAGNSPAYGEFPAQRPVTRSFDVFFDMRPNKQLCKQSWGWWFETPLWSLWRHRNGSVDNCWSYNPRCNHRLWLFVQCAKLGNTLQWRHNGCDGVLNYQSHDWLLNRLFRRRSKKVSKLRVTGLCAGNSPGNSQYKWPVTRKIFPFHDVTMACPWLFAQRAILGNSSEWETDRCTHVAVRDGDELISDLLLAM